MIIEEDSNNVRILTLNHANKHNPFNLKLEEEIKAALQKADRDEHIQAVVVYGGKGRSFSCGGDFNEVRKLSGGPEVEQWIDRVIDLYTAVLNLSKPSIAAIEGYAIGMGFQFAMMFDQRIMAHDAQLIMPELKHGIGCSVGAAILNFTHGHNRMKNIVLACDELGAEECLHYALVDQVISREALLPVAIRRAEQMAGYPRVAFSNTKQSFNRDFITVLERTRVESKRVHRRAFAAREAQHHFSHILGN